MQLDLIHEDLRGAVMEVAALCGGAKALAVAVWPAKGTAAHSHLLDCLNPDRPHKLAPDELITIARLGRERGSNAVMNFLCGEAGYEQAQPRNLQEQMDETRKQIAVGLQFLQANMSKLERLSKH